MYKPGILFLFIIMALSGPPSVGQKPTGEEFDPAMYNDPKYIQLGEDVRFGDTSIHIIDTQFYSVKNQSPYQTCVGHACAAAFTIRRMVKYPDLPPIDFSADWIYHKIKPHEARDCDTDTKILEALMSMETDGVCPLSMFPEACGDSITKEMEIEASKHKINLLGSLPVDSREKWKQIIRQGIYQNFPVVIGMSTPSSFSDCSAAHWLPKKGERPDSSPKHAMVIVGYNDNYRIKGRKNGAFLLLNSWGTAWGTEGFVWISYQDFENWVHGAYLFDVPPETPKGIPVLGTIHLILVADTQHPELGKSIKMDAFNMQSTWQEIAIANNFHLEKYILKGDSAGLPNLERVISNMKCDTTDVIVFYFSGYGNYENPEHIILKLNDNRLINLRALARRFKNKGRLRLFFADCSDKMLEKSDLLHPFRGLLFKRKEFEALLRQSKLNEQHGILNRETAMKFYGLLTDWKGTVIALNRMPGYGRPGTKEYRSGEKVFSTPYGSHFTNALVSSFRFFARRNVDWYSILLYAASKTRQFSYIARRFRDDEQTPDFEMEFELDTLKKQSPMYPPLPNEPAFEENIDCFSAAGLTLAFKLIQLQHNDDIRESMVQKLLGYCSDSSQIIYTNGNIVKTLKYFMGEVNPDNHHDIEVLKIELDEDCRPFKIYIKLTKK